MNLKGVGPDGTTEARVPNMSQTWRGSLSYLHVRKLAMSAPSGINLRATRPQAIVSVNGDEQVCICLSFELAH